MLTKVQEIWDSTCVISEQFEDAKCTVLRVICCTLHYLQGFNHEMVSCCVLILNRFVFSGDIHNSILYSHQV